MPNLARAGIMAGLQSDDLFQLRCRIYELKAHAQIRQLLSPTALLLPFWEETSNFRDVILV